MRFGSQGARAGEVERRVKLEVERAPVLSLSSFVLAIAVGVVSSFTFSAAFDMAQAHSKSVIQMLPFTSAYSKTIWFPSGDQIG